MLDDSRLNFRKAADTDAHDEAIVANINRIVGEDDELWILGDIGYRTSVRHLKSACVSCAQASARGYRQSR